MMDLLGSVGGIVRVGDLGSSHTSQQLRSSRLVNVQCLQDHVKILLLLLLSG